MAFEKVAVANTIQCPCRRCLNMIHKTRNEVALDLVKFGMDQNYKKWTHHGEEWVNESSNDNSEGVDNESDQERCFITIVGSGVSSSGSRENGESRSEIGLTERLTNILVDEGDRDLLLQLSDHEDHVMQWLQALDMQVMGACRVDERLKPLLKMNALNGVVEDCLLVHLSQEIGMVATEALHGFTNLAFWTELHGLAALQWSICQDSLNRYIFLLRFY
ncbi:hypothetical protein FCV25MIE_33942 [Fagus crenata]